MRTGRLRHRIRVERRVAGDDGFGNKRSENWSTLIAEIRADLTARQSGEAAEHDRQTGFAAFDCRVRYSAATRGIAAGDRVVNIDTSETYAVTSPAVDRAQRKQWITFSAEQGRGDGATQI